MREARIRGLAGRAPRPRPCGCGVLARGTSPGNRASAGSRRTARARIRICSPLVRKPRERWPRPQGR
eukprot:2464666-Pyramimonas_sp.AAC.1